MFMMQKVLRAGKRGGKVVTLRAVSRDFGSLCHVVAPRIARRRKTRTPLDAG